MRPRLMGVVVLYSMTCSSAEDAPRDMEFLYSPSRLNVSISRPRRRQLLSVTQASSAFNVALPEQLKLANALCRVVGSSSG